MPSSLNRRSENHIRRVVGGRWEIVAPLAEGGMGSLYIARHMQTGRRAALKVLDRGDPQAVARFAREASIAAQVGHPDIVDVLDAGDDDDGRSCFIAMELLSGRTLREVMDDPQTQAQHLVDLLCVALHPLAAAHEKGIVHRDLKPENIFVLEPARGCRVKLLDFGIAAQPSDNRLTLTGTTMGTPHYMSPEQAVDARTALPSADVWAIGVMLYEAIRGEVPFGGDTAHAVIIGACTRPHEPLERCVPGVDPMLCNVIDRCLEKEPHLRPADAGHLLAELRAVLRPTSLPAGPRHKGSASLPGNVASGLRRRLPLSESAPPPEPPRALPRSGMVLTALCLLLLFCKPWLPATAEDTANVLLLLALSLSLWLVLLGLGPHPLHALARRLRPTLASIRPLAGGHAGNGTRRLPAQNAATYAHPSRGPDRALVTIELYVDITCPHSRRVAQRILRLHTEHPGEVRVVWKAIPQAGRTHTWVAAETLRAVFERCGNGPFWALVDAALGATRKVTPEWLEELGVSAGAPLHELRRQLRVRMHRAIVIVCREEAVSRGAPHSPAVFVNDRLHSGDLDEDSLRWYLRDALQAATNDPAELATLPGVGGKLTQSTVVRAGLIRFQGARGAPPSLQRTRDQALLRAEKLKARALLPGADFGDLALRFSDALIEPDYLSQLGESVRSTGVRLQPGEVSQPVVADEGYYVLQRVS